MFSYSKSIINNRWDSMPENLREILSSPAYGGTVFEIADDHHLSEEKTKILLRLVSFVIYGLVHVDELNKKTAKETDIDIKAAEEIADELNKKIFSQFKAEISNMYSPIPLNDFEKEPSESKEGKSISIEGVAGNISIGDSSKDQKIEISKEKLKQTTETTKQPEPIKDAKPFILSQDKNEKENKKSKRKNIEKRKKSFSFATDGFFSSNKNEKESPKADIQAPGNKDNSGGGFFGFGNKNKKDKQEKIVHYSDNRTSLSDNKSGSFMNLSNLKSNKSESQPIKNDINKNINNKENLNKTEGNKNTSEKRFINKKQPENISEEKAKNKKNLEKNKSSDTTEGNVKNNESNNDSFLGNINITKNKKKEDKNKKKDSDGPKLDGNTVNLRNNNSSN